MSARLARTAGGWWLVTEAGLIRLGLTAPATAALLAGRAALAAAIRSDRICQALGSTATPRLKAGALQHSGRRPLPPGIPAALRPGGLIPNPLVTTGDGTPVRLDAILAGRAAVLTARRPGAELADYCSRHGLVLARISRTAPGTTSPRQPGANLDADYIDVRLADGRQAAGLQVLAASPAMTVLVRPDRVIAAVKPRSRLPRLPWPTPATAVRRCPAPAHPPDQTDPACPFPVTH
jgi:3-(3-hydroxy-phenyl)propionate hydroxylase